jgi:GDP/UDP-N,N'-diacetylbacillosamine 2-epimerase (hydrolysing)
VEIAILTSSRSDFGFYKPLLNLLKTQSEINYTLVVFGTHLSKKHGYTLNEIKDSGYTTISEVKIQLKGDKAKDITKTIGETHIKFAEFWESNVFDLILCIGDRYEMFAAVSASIPFNIPIAHISGGEVTLGAIDNIYRNSLSLMANYHFTNTQKNAERLTQILGTSKNIYHTGSLAVDNINETKLYFSEEFKSIFHFDINEPFVLFTFHPETANFKKNQDYARVIKDTLSDFKTNVLVTMPNADTMGDVIREALYYVALKNKNVFLIESLGSKGYFTALKRCVFVMGNSSSGIVEAASFSKYVINLGIRQLGREHGTNVIHCDINKAEIFKAIQKIEKLPQLGGVNIYGDGKASNKILKVLKKISEKKI